MTTNRAVSYSEVDTYRQCRLKHQLSYHENWRSDEVAPALSRGTLFHSVMENHYNILKEVGAEEATHEDLFLAVAPLLYEDGTGNQTEEQELVTWIYKGYVEMFGLDSDWEIVEVEYNLREPIPFTDFDLAGTADLIVRDNSAGGGLWIVDHKTCSNMPKQKDFDMEDQTGLYTYLLRRAGFDIRGAIYNHCRTKKLVRPMTLDERYKRTLTVRTDRELETMVREVGSLMSEAYLWLDRTPEGMVFDAARSPDGERCGWKCNFTEACLAGRKGGPERTREFLEDTGFKKHDTKPGPTFARLATEADGG